MYNIPADYRPQTGSQSRLAFANFLGQSVRAADLYNFEDSFSIPRQGFSVEFINGGTQSQNISRNDHIETNIDVQMLTGVAPGLDITSYNSGGGA